MIRFPSASQTAVVGNAKPLHGGRQVVRVEHDPRGRTIVRRRTSVKPIAGRWAEQDLNLPEPQPNVQALHGDDLAPEHLLVKCPRRQRVADEQLVVAEMDGR